MKFTVRYLDTTYSVKSKIVKANTPKEASDEVFETLENCVHVLSVTVH
tara:strand:- start:52 stop:195 length:144 start_codon:yes stop_codon:yes gene_type:complete